MIFQALPGTKPIPFWQVPLRGCCNWILEDNPASMSDALCCGAPTERPRDRYCEAHETAGTNASAWGPKLSAKALVRRYGNLRLMLFWGYGEMTRLREMHQRGAKFPDLVKAWPAHTRDEVVEAYWALLRNENAWRAMDEANMCIDAVGKIPLVNGSPAHEVTPSFRRSPAYRPQF